MNIVLSKASDNYIDWLSGERYNLINAYKSNNLDSILQIANGIVLTGGEDINPLLYNDSSNLELCETIDHYRDTLEKTIFKFALQNNIPTIGICRGMQMINVLLGGTLYGDLPKQLGSNVAHRQNGEVFHEIYLKENDNFYNTFILPKENSEIKFIVNSWHHQGLRDLADGVIVLAKSKDNLPEAIVIDTNIHKFMVAVQFHPERLDEKNIFSSTVRNNFYKSIHKKKQSE